MRNYLFIFSLLYVSLGYSQSFQDSVLLLNGKSFRCDVIGMEGPTLHFKIDHKDEKKADFFVADYRVFSYTKNQTETIVYKYDEDIGNFLKVDESKRYAIGAYDARKTYKTPVVFWSSLAAGLGVSIWDTYLTKATVNDPEFINSNNLTPGFFKSNPTLLPLAVPIVMSVSFGLPNMRVRDKHILHKNMVNDKMYYQGYNTYSKQKRAFSALKGSAIGVGLGLLSYAILRGN
jgi:hypothetical protein